jgi:hypothetical protein
MLVLLKWLHVSRKFVKVELYAFPLNPSPTASVHTAVQDDVFPLKPILGTRELTLVPAKQNQ